MIDLKVGVEYSRGLEGGAYNEDPIKLTLTWGSYR